MTMFDAKQIANWFLAKHKAMMIEDDAIDPMTQMKLHKLLYYAQGVYLAVSNDRLFSNDILHWDHGPVVEEIFQEYKGRKSIDDDITEHQLSDFRIVNSDEMANSVLEAVYDKYAEYSGSQLRNMTHSERPWMETKHNEVIPVELIRDYFKSEVVE